MELAAYVERMLARRRRAELAHSPQWTLGKLVDGLTDLAVCALAEPARPILVVFDDGDRPRHFGSWRGAYCELAIEPGGTVPVTLGAFLGDAKGAIGEKFAGYKGGEFVMGRETPLWVATWGNADQRAVVGLRRNDEGHVVIETQELPYLGY